MNSDLFRQIPQVNDLLALPNLAALADQWTRGELVVALRRQLDEQVSRSGAEAGAQPAQSDPDGPERRTEQRFDVTLEGSARPLLASPELTERTFPITILDLSRSGMRFLADANAPLYPLAEINFTGPNGRVRSVFVKLVRMRMLYRGATSGQKKCEIAARSIDENAMLAAFKV